MIEGQAISLCGLIHRGHITPTEIRLLLIKHHRGDVGLTAAMVRRDVSKEVQRRVLDLRSRERRVARCREIGNLMRFCADIGQQVCSIFRTGNRRSPLILTLRYD